MRIAMVSEHASPLASIGGVDAGGQNVYVAALSIALARRGHDVTVYTRRDDADQPAVVTMASGVSVVHLDAGPPIPLAKDLLLPYVPELADGLQRALRRSPPCLVHAHFWMSGLAATRAAGPLHLPVLQTFHALGEVKHRHQGRADSSPPERRVRERELIAGVDRIIASCSDEVLELLALGADRSRIDVVPCGVDTVQFSPDGPAAPRTARPRLLALGRLVPRKGVDDAIRALARIPEAELVVAGGPLPLDLDDDAEVGRLRKLAAELGVGERVDIRGQIAHDELPALIRSADVVLCLPWYEPFGIVPIEAMACGVPVVGTAVGGLLDTVVSGVTGRLVEPRRPDLAAAAVADLLAVGRMRREYGAAGAARARARYGWDTVAEGAERAYRSAVREHSDRSERGPVGPGAGQPTGADPTDSELFTQEAFG